MRIIYKEHRLSHTDPIFKNVNRLKIIKINSIAKTVF